MPTERNAIRAEEKGGGLRDLAGRKNPSGLGKTLPSASAQDLA